MRTCLWMRPRNLSHVSSSLMLPTDDSLARYLAEKTQHNRTSLMCSRWPERTWRSQRNIQEKKWKLQNLMSKWYKLRYKQDRGYILSPPQCHFGTVIVTVNVPLQNKDD